MAATIQDMEKFAIEICKSYPLIELQRKTGHVVEAHMVKFYSEFWAESSKDEKFCLSLYVTVKVIADKMRMALDNWKD